MLKFLWDFRYDILFIIWFVITCIIKSKDWRDKKIHEYMLAAKQMSKDGFLKSGDEQQEWVFKVILLFINTAPIKIIIKITRYFIFI